MKRQQDDATTWASFTDVIGQVTEPIVTSTLERVATETTKLKAAIDKVGADVVAVSIAQDETARKLRSQTTQHTTAMEDLFKRIEQARTDLSAGIEQTHQSLSAEAEENRQELAKLRETLTVTLKEIADEIRDRDAVFRTELDELVTAARTSVGADLQSFRTDAAALATRMSAVERLTRIAAVLSLVIAVTACVIALLT